MVGIDLKRGDPLRNSLEHLEAVVHEMNVRRQGAIEVVLHGQRPVHVHLLTGGKGRGLREGAPVFGVSRLLRVEGDLDKVKRAAAKHKDPRLALIASGLRISGNIAFAEALSRRAGGILEALAPAKRGRKG